MSVINRKIKVKSTMSVTMHLLRLLLPKSQKRASAAKDAEKSSLYAVSCEGTYRKAPVIETYGVSMQNLELSESLEILLLGMWY